MSAISVFTSASEALGFILAKADIIRMLLFETACSPLRKGHDGIAI